MSKPKRRQDRWEGSNARIVGRLVFSESSRPGLYDWLANHYGNRKKEGLKGSDVLDALEDFMKKGNNIEEGSMNSFEVLTSSETNEWYTPEWIFDYVRRVGEIGLDPASNAIAQQWIKAEKFYTKDDDGFSKSWETNKGLWLNPPYGGRRVAESVYGAGAWIHKAIDEWVLESFPWAILLVRGDSIGVHRLEQGFMSCEPLSRIAFVSPSDPGKKNPVPGCRFWYLGDEQEKFAKVFSEIGAIRMPWSDNNIPQRGVG